MIAVLCPFGLDAGLVSKAVSFGLPVDVLVAHKDTAQAARLGVTTIHTCDVASADDRAVALWLKELVTRWESKVVLAPATVRMRGIMPILAWYMGAGLTADCTGLAMDGQRLLQTRPAFGNSLVADIQTVSSVQMATVRPGTFPAVLRPGTPTVVQEICAVAEESVQLEEMQAQQADAPLQQAKIIVAGGLGVGSKEGFERLSKFAERIGAVVAASRSAVDAGFAPYRCQVGMTGVTVCPKLYIAVGISGAVQHIAGMSGAEKVIAINIDPKAPIFDYADYGVVGDWETVLNHLEDLL